MKPILVFQEFIMPPSIRLFFLQAHSPIHVGVGEGLGHVNLPTAREQVTGHPYLPGSSIKGVLREHAELGTPTNDTSRYGNDPVVKVFGPPTERAGDARGGVVFSDARLFFLPIRSIVGGFALATCPLILVRLRRELRLAEKLTEEQEKWFETLIRNGQSDQALVHPDSVILLSSGDQSAVLMEDLRVPAQAVEAMSSLAEALSGWGAWQKDDGDFFSRRLVVLPDTDFSHFARLGLELRHRVKIDADTGTAATSGPWLEEYIPAESLFFGLVQGRSTVLVHQTTPDGQPRDPVACTGQDCLEDLSGLVRPGTLLRFGGKSSGGAGRAFFRLV
ncbi:MAG: type III-B CRISPR module RAMP protein Cmr4 [Proteobacteria bacterium]|nr:type III-B CRISPR module RAMP protein Cmr4 [Pseudomonadota bacterium]